MRRMLIGALAVVAASATPAAAQGTFGVLEEETVGATPRRKALLIGIDSYEDPSFPTLRFASADAIDLGKVLLDPAYGGFAGVEVVTNGDLSARNLVARLKQWAATLAPEDLAFVYFSGHGTRRLDDRNRSHVYLAASDTRKNDPLTTAIPLEAMQEFMTTLPTQKRVLAIDACFTGTGKVDREDAEAAAKAAVDDAQPFTDTTRGKEAQLFATTYGRPALESKSRGHGVYTHHLIEALKERFDEADINGDRVVSVSEAHDHARDKTLEDTGEAQVPMAFYRIIGREDLLLSGSEDNRLRAKYALLTSYGKPQQGIVVFIDGEEKGAFPRTVLIEPGPHRIEFKTLSGRRIDGGRVTFKPETPYDVSRIRDELNGGRHQLSVGYAHWWVPGAMVTQVSPEANGLRIGYGFRFPGRSPFLRRLGLTLDMAFGVFEPTVEPGPRVIDGVRSDGEFVVPRTVMLEVGIGPLLRLDIPFGLLALQPRVAVVNLLRTDEAIGIPNWVYLSGGAEFIVGARPHNRVSIQGRYAPMFFNSRLQDAGPPKLEVSHRLGVAVEVGF